MPYQLEIKSLISRLFDISIEKISPDSHLKNDLGLDSLDIAEITVECELNYNMIFPDTAMDKIHYVADIIKLVNEYKPSQISNTVSSDTY
jgi:acyl carrier protein